ncbi:hypothetical protein [Vibrio hyugaensis]|uniref:hypothetical protein n=1 Tax=Vibrio hyugaensis TaxID=1534743 RepID=UPI003DA159FD
MPFNHLSRYSELTDDHYALIGKVVVEWSNIETLLGEILSRLIFTPAFPAQIVTKGMGAARIQSAITDALELHKLRYRYSIVSEGQQREISKVNKRLNDLRKTRNQFAHFCWSRVSDDEIFGMSFSGIHGDSKKANKDVVTYKIDDLKGFYECLYSIVDELQAIVGALPEMEEDNIKNKLTETIA